MGQSSIVITLFSLILICATNVSTKKDPDVDIYSFHINSTVTSRYAITVVTSRVANRLNESKEVHFEVKIPKNAFISKFRMTIEGKTYDGVVKKKEEAQQQYSEAVSRGESAGLVSSVGRTLEDFKTSVTVAAFNKVTFELTYEELLKRRLGKYELLINAQPMQPVADFKVDVYIHESPGISFLEVKGGLSTNKLASAITTTHTKKVVWVNFYPTREHQTNCEGCGENGLNGDLLILYDVERPESKGELQVLNGYFVHYFAPTNVQRIPKNVVFVIDVSGSMAGRKIEQTRLALLKILRDLAENDYFGLLTFDHKVEVWKSELLQATESNVNAAKAFVRKMQDRGSTDINAALLKGVEMINRFPREGTASGVILLTDGNPTSGMTNIETIQNNVKQAIQGKFPLYCLGFGFDVKFTFLEKMALENNGVARRIYEDSDADLQLQGFYEEVATPLLTDVQMNYIGAANLTQLTFSQYYNGSEIVVAGQILDNSLETFQTEVIAVSTDSKVTYQDSVSLKDIIDVLPQHENFIERLWAFLTVKQLLGKELTLIGHEKEKAKKEAVDLSLKYNFVTPFTSLVVTKPEKEETQVSDKPIEMKPADRHAGRQRNMARTGGLQKKRQFLKISSATAINTKPFQEFMQVYDSVRRISSEDAVMFKVKRKPAELSTSTPPVSGVRFLIAAQDQPIPICYDVPVGHKLNLLSDPLTGFLMNGQLSQKGFIEILIHFNKNHSLSITINNISFYEDSNHVTFQWEQDYIKHETDSKSLILRNNELNVSIGGIRVVFMRHKKGQDVFLWPAVRQQPNNAGMQGILGKHDLQYELLPASLIKIKDQTMEATRSIAVDLQLPSAPSVSCWLVSFKFALQGELSDYTVSQL